MVVDASRFVPGFPPFVGMLWIVEQIPGTCAAADVTPVLVEQGGYWPSYNIPYFPAVYQASGYPAMAAKYGSQYVYAECDRANIFRRNQSDVVDRVTARNVLRYNNYANDPLAGGDPILGSISSRGDLRATTPVAFGGIDTKVTSLGALGPGGPIESLAESGPTHDQQIPFAWSSYPSFVNISRIDVPPVFNFPTIIVRLQ